MRALLLAGVVAFGWTGAAYAAVVVTFAEVGNDVVASGSGTLDISGLTYHSSIDTGSGIDPNTATVYVGSVGGTEDFYEGYTGPSSFGSGGTVLADLTAGQQFGIQYEGTPGDLLDLLAVPGGFVSNQTLSGSDTFSDATFASLGLTAGTYVYTLPNDTFTVQIGAATAVPEPASLALLALPMGAAGLVVARRRRKGESGA